MDYHYYEIGKPLSFLNQNTLQNDLTHLKFKKESFKFDSFSYKKKLISIFYLDEFFTPSIVELIMKHSTFFNIELELLTPSCLEEINKRNPNNYREYIILIDKLNRAKKEL
jgi:hypothetical protein